MDLSELNVLIVTCTDSLDNYKLMEPVRAIRDFINDLSTWYLRRSRDRLKDNDADAKHTLHTVLMTVAKLLAPFAPFASEDIYQQLKNKESAVSIHLTNWPVVSETSFEEVVLLQHMIEVRGICTTGNALRKKLGIPVRQPLQAITVKSEALPSEYLELIQDELNVKSVLFDTSIEEPAVLDTEITPILKAEGEYRELVAQSKIFVRPKDLLQATLFLLPCITK